jgi:hypothetical protein|tara:strand:+ start:127 stop:1152 length:1026 start_codon:yes stop_codon:yes gene_type:complete
MVDSIFENLDNIQENIVVKTNASKAVMKEIVSSIRSIKKSIEQEILNNSLTDTNGVNDDKLDFWEWLNTGSKAETTFIKDYDRIFKWKYGWVNTWTGYSNEGKSSWLYFLILIKLLNDPNAKVAVFSPENYPRNKFVKDWLKTMLGVDPRHSTKAKCERLIEQFNDRLFYVYPSEHDIESIEKQFINLIKLHKVNITVIDPYLKITKPSGVPDLSYLTSFIKRQEVFAKKYNISHHVVYHQLTPSMGEDGNYIPVDMYKIKGGGSITDGSDVVCSVQRPFRKSDEASTQVEIKTQKVKDFDVFKDGYLKLDYNLQKNRYSYQGKDIFEEAMKLKSPKTELF